MMKKGIFALMCIVVTAFAQSSMITKVIELHYQNAEHIIQLVQPLYIKVNIAQQSTSDTEH